MDQTNKLLSIGEAADYLGVSIDTLRRWEKKGKIPTYRSPGGHRYFKEEDLKTIFGTKYDHFLTDEDKSIISESNIDTEDLTKGPGDQTPIPSDLPSSTPNNNENQTSSNDILQDDKKFQDAELNPVVNNIPAASVASEEQKEE